MTRKLRKICSLSLELMESRMVLSGTSPWPVDLPANTNISLLHTYGQYVESGGQVLTHSGIDILVPVGTNVRAIDAGTVHGVNNDGPPNPAHNRWVSVNGGTSAGITFISHRPSIR
jgi:murein DD-endopeptidase MepM/ murein hydrolase activator NlpD